MPDGRKEIIWRQVTEKTGEETISDIILAFITLPIIGVIIYLVIIFKRIYKSYILPAIDRMAAAYNATVEWLKGAYAYTAEHIGTWLRYAGIAVAIAAGAALVVFAVYKGVKKAKERKKLALIEKAKKEEIAREERIKEEKEKQEQEARQRQLEQQAEKERREKEQRETAEKYRRLRNLKIESNTPIQPNAIAILTSRDAFTIIPKVKYTKDSNGKITVQGAKSRLRIQKGDAVYLKLSSFAYKNNTIQDYFLVKLDSANGKRTGTITQSESGQPEDLPIKYKGDSLCEINIQENGEYGIIREDWSEDGQKIACFGID